MEKSNKAIIAKAVTPFDQAQFPELVTEQNQHNHAAATASP